MNKVALYASGANPGHIENAMLSSAGYIVLCLEDGTPEDKKDEARFLVKHALANKALRRNKRKIVVRINGVETTHIADDLQVILSCAKPPNAIRVPMIKNSEQFELVLSYLAEYKYLDKGKIELMVENVQILDHLDEILSLHGHLLSCITIGGEDLANSLISGSSLDDIKKTVISLANYYSLPTLETTFMDYSNLPALKENTKKAKELGFWGRSVIHPAHVAICTKIFKG
ncbi:MAG: HpcH/HpaI aldolase/citrate lyase family protein [Vibrio sp.]